MSKRSQKYASQSVSRSNTYLLGIGLVVIVLLAAAAFFLLNSGDDEPTDTAEIVEAQLITAQDYNADFISQEHLLVDVRTPEEFAEGHIAGAINISLQEIEQRMDEIPQDIPVVLYCRSGNRSAQAADILSEAGYARLYDLGGIQDWQAAGYPVE